MGEIHIDLDDNPNGGRVATVCYDNEAKLNVVAKDDADALAAAIERVGASPDLRAVVLRGKGERALIGGADIRFMVDVTPEAARPFITSIHDVCDAIRRTPVPVVARMSGFCLGAGLEIAASCDLRVADATARSACRRCRSVCPRSSRPPSSRASSAGGGPRGSSTPGRSSAPSRRTRGGSSSRWRPRARSTTRSGGRWT